MSAAGDVRHRQHWGKEHDVIPHDAVRRCVERTARRAHVEGAALAGACCHSSLPLFDHSTARTVVDMTNKNTGDVLGDTSFVISRRTSAYECKKDPTNFMCSGIAQFSGQY